MASLDKHFVSDCQELAVKLQKLNDQIGALKSQMHGSDPNGSHTEKQQKKEESTLSNGQLLVKYQKLATEYSKIRAQASVLKKAVVDEQVHNTELREQLKEKEVELRKSEQELDSLTFRNQQLTKRVTVLQEDLDRIQNKPKKSRNKSVENKTQPVPPSSQTHILDEEFQKKIIENAQLLSQISDRNIEIDGLNDRIQQLEYKLEISEKCKIEIDTRYHELMEKFEREKEMQRRMNDKYKQEETVSWSSSEGKRENYDFDIKSNHLNSRHDHSPFSSPTASRRSSKSTVEMGPTRKLWQNNQEETNSNEFEFTKYCDIEKELNNWKSEYNILKIKYDELSQKDNTNNKIQDLTALEPFEVSNMIGKLTAPFPIPEEIEARELKIKEYFLQEIDRLIKEKHMYHVKNIAIVSNIEVVNAHLTNSEQIREKCEVALTEALSKWQNIQEDKETQEGNYKSQLITMSEHLANMNEKLISQTEEIQHLKYELMNKNTKRGK